MTASSCSQPTTPEPQKMEKGLTEGGQEHPLQNVGGLPECEARDFLEVF